MGLVANAPAKVEIFVLYSQYGVVSGAVAEGRSRLWLIAESADPLAAMKVIVAVNDQQTGQVVYHDLGYATQVDMRGYSSINVMLADGRTVSHLTAPCVCGAGAVGYAGPTQDRHKIIMVDPRNHQGVTVG